MEGLLCRRLWRREIDDSEIDAVVVMMRMLRSEIDRQADSDVF